MNNKYIDLQVIMCSIESNTLRLFLSFLFVFSFNFLMAQGPYSPAAGQEGSDAIHRNYFAITGWATGCTIERGYQDVANKSLGYTDVGSTSSGVGYADGNVVSLGDSGVAILTFTTPISNTLGPDFAVFENSFDDSFLELAFVEVSSDGINFYRFNAVSLTDTTTQTGTFGNTDPTNLYNFAGKYRAQYGTPFDLEEIKGIAGLDVNNITHVKIIDVIGSIDNNYATRDAQGNMVNDPYPTAFGSGGFDLDGVAVLGNITGITENINLEINIYPNPVCNILNIIGNNNDTISILDAYGRQVMEGFGNKIDVSALRKGIYFLFVENTSLRFVKH